MKHSSQTGPLRSRVRSLLLVGALVVLSPALLILVFHAFVACQTVLGGAGQIWLGARYGAACILAGISALFLLNAAWILPIRFVQLAPAVLP